MQFEVLVLIYKGLLWLGTMYKTVSSYRTLSNLMIMPGVAANCSTLLTSQEGDVQKNCYFWVAPALWVGLLLEIRFHLATFQKMLTTELYQKAFGLQHLFVDIVICGSSHA